jgi:hypothetical protein
MTRLTGAVLTLALVAGWSGLVRAEDDKDPKAILDKAVKALGGEDKLSKVKAATWKGKGTLTFMGSDNDIATETTVQGLDHVRAEFEGDFGGNKIKGATVLAGDKGWRKFGDMNMDLDKDAVANEKRTIYLTVIPITILPLKSKEFKVEAIGEDKVGGKAAVGIKATGPDAKEFKLYFDKESGLPVKLVAKVVGFTGEEYVQETTYSDYKEMGGIKKATKIQSKRDGEKFIEMTFSDFKVLDKVDPKTFTEPK